MCVSGFAHIRTHLGKGLWAKEDGLHADLQDLGLGISSPTVVIHMVQLVVRDHWELTLNLTCSHSHTASHMQPLTTLWTISHINIYYFTRSNL